MNRTTHVDTMHFCNISPRHRSFSNVLATRTKLAISAAVGVAVGVSVLGCVGSVDPERPEVVVFASLDREFSEPIFAQFTSTTGIRVFAKYDTEANKTVGLTHLILNQPNRATCDVFWNNEILNTLRLDNANLLLAYPSPASLNYPAQYRSADHRWFGFSARARVLLVNTKRVGPDAQPSSILDLTSDRWRDEVGIAKPLFGTTATHAACLFAVWGKQKTTRFFTQLSEHANVLPGNRQVANAVGAGQLAFGLTDTDDAMIEIAAGRPVTIVYPDQAEGELGTLFIPNTVCLVARGPHPAAAKQLVDFLLSAETEKQLAEGESAQIPLQRGVMPTPDMRTPNNTKAMVVDFEQAAREWESAALILRDLYLRAR